MWDDEVVQAIFNEAENGVASAQLVLARAYSSGRTINGVRYPIDYEEALKYYTLAADQGSPDALNELGVMYERGQGTTKDRIKAIELFQLATDMGDSFGARNLSRYFASGEILVKNLEQAFSLMLQSAKQGNEWSAFDVALMYGKGTGTEESQKEAANWFRYAAEKDHPRANYNLANRYFNGNGVPKDETEGCEFLLRAAELGDVDAQAKLADLFRAGKAGLPKEDQEAFKWSQRAADQGHTASMVRVARAFRDGCGVDQDVQAAINWYQKLIALPPKNISLSASLLDMEMVCLPDEAYIELGRIYLAPEYSVVNGQLAEEYLSKAWDDGEWIDAALELGKGFLLGSVLIKDESKAFLWFKRAYDKVMAIDLFDREEGACGWLSHCYESGIGIARSPTLAFEIYRPMADLGQAWAQLKLARYFESGFGVPRDYQQAYYWANIAAASGDEKATELRNELEALLTKSQIAESQRAAAKWKPKSEKDT